MDSDVRGGNVSSESGEIMSTSDVMRELDVSRNTVLGYIESGELAAMDAAAKSVAYWRINRSDFEAFKKKRQAAQ